MYHVGLRQEKKQEVSYTNLKQAEEKETVQVPNDDSVPQAPDGFVFYRVQSGDTLVSLSVRFGVSQNKIRRYNNKVCFGHRLTHIIGKLLLIPTQSTANLTIELKEQLNQIYMEDENEQNKFDENIDDRKYNEPDENGKYQLKKALMFHAKGIDEHRADYYLGEANWNVRKALNLWRDDDKWEKQHNVMKTCKLSADEALQLLENYNWDISAAIHFWQKQQKKLGKKDNNDDNEDNNDDTTEGRTTTKSGWTEMQPVTKGGKDDKRQSLMVDNENDNDVDKENENEFNNIAQGSLTSGFCCGN